MPTVPGTASAPARKSWFDHEAVANRFGRGRARRSVVEHGQQGEIASPVPRNDNMGVDHLAGAGKMIEGAGLDVGGASGATTSDTVSGLLEQFDADHAKRFTARVRTMAQFNPEEVAKRYGLSRRSGLPMEAPEADPNAGERMVVAESLSREAIDALRADKPAFYARVMRDPAFAAMVVDEFEHASSLEGLFPKGRVRSAIVGLLNRVPGGPEPAAFTDAKHSFQSGIEQYGHAGLGSGLFQKVASGQGVSDQDRADAQRALRRMEELAPSVERGPIRGALITAVGQIPIMAGAIGTRLAGAGAGAIVGGAAGYAAGSPIPVLAPVTFAAGRSAGAKAGGAAAGFAFGAWLEGGNAMVEFTAMTDEAGEPIDPEAAASAAAAVGVINGILEMAGFSQVRKVMPGADRFAKAVAAKATIKNILANPTARNRFTASVWPHVRAMLAEGTTESLQRVTNIVMGQIAENDKGLAHALSQVATQENLSQLVAEGIGGAQVAGVFGLGGAMTRGIREFGGAEEAIEKGKPNTSVQQGVVFSGDGQTAQAQGVGVEQQVSEQPSPLPTGEVYDTLEAASTAFYQEVEEAAAGQRDGLFIERVGEWARKGLLTQRSPEAVAEFVDEVAARAVGEGLETVRVSPAAIREHLEAKPDDVAVFRRAMPDFDTQMAQAQEVGGDVLMSTGRWAAYVAPTPVGEAIQEHLKLRPGAMTARDAAEGGAAMQAEMKRLLERSMAETDLHRESEVVFEEMQAGFTEEIEAASADAKGMTPKQRIANARSGAALRTAMAMNIARKTGRSVREVASRWLAPVKAGPALPGLAGAQLDQVAFHGSPHTFKEFSSEKIGTGEGAQAYGYGMYFAGNRKVAEFYRDRFQATNDNVNLSHALMEKHPEIFDEVLEALEAAGNQRSGWNAAIAVRGILESKAHPSYISDELAQRILSVRESLTQSARLYTAELAPAEDEYLLWDAPLSGQSEMVKAALTSDALNAFGGESITNPGQPKTIEEYDRTGQMFHATLYDRFRSAKEASEYLRSLGIRGIKYLDRSSRSKGEGDYNYVIFDDSDVTITRLEQEVEGDLPRVAAKSLGGRMMPDPALGLEDPFEFVVVPEIWELLKDAKADAANATIHIQTPERQAMREQASRDMLTTDYPVLRERQAWLVLGPPGAGKSIVSGAVKRERGAVEIDADIAKKHPGLAAEYASGLGAARVHQESAQITDDAFDHAVEAGLNLVQPMIGKNYEALVERTQALRDAGYTVNVSLVDISPQKSVQRAYKRFYDDGRHVPADYILFDVDDRAARNYLKLLDSGMIASDGWEAISGERSRTEEPERVSPDQLRAQISARDESLALHGRRFLGDIEGDARRHVARLIIETLPAGSLGKNEELFGGEELSSAAPAVEPSDTAPSARPTIAELSRTDIQQDLIPGADNLDQGMLFQELDPRQTIPGIYGEDTAIEFEDVEPYPARYKVVEVTDLIPSHDFTSGAPSRNFPERYPESLQPRNLDENQSQVGRILTAARNWKAGDANSTSEFATTGPPSVGPDGLVMNGNGRVGAAQLAVAEGKFTKNKKFLMKAAAIFGIDPAAIAGMNNPILVREMPFGGRSAPAARFAALGNVSTTGNESPVREAEKLNRIMGKDLLRLIDLDARTTRAALTDEAVNQELRTLLRANLPKSEQKKFLTEEGDLTEIGVVLVEDMVLTQYLPVKTVERLRAPGNRKALLNTIESAIPALQRVAANTASTPGVPPVDLQPALREALDWLSLNTKAGTDKKSQTHEALSFIDEPLTGATQMMVQALLKYGHQPRIFRNLIEKFRGRIEGGMGIEPEDAVTAFAETFEVAAQEGAAFAPEKRKAGESPAPIEFRELTGVAQGARQLPEPPGEDATSEPPYIPEGGTPAAVIPGSGKGDEFKGMRDKLKGMEARGTGQPEGAAQGPAPLKKVRGFLELGTGPGTRVIRLTPKANFSTFAHEMGHEYLFLLNDFAGESAEIDADLKASLGWVGAESVETMTKAQHEQFANGFLKYLQEGKIPEGTDAQVVRAFKNFRNWLVQMWRTRRFQAIEGIELSDEIRAVFDRMVASDAAVDEARHAGGARPIYAARNDANMTDAEWAQYTEDAQGIVDDAHARMDATAMQAAARRETVAYRDEVVAQMKAVRKEFEKRKDWKARRFLMRGEMAGVEKAEAHRLDDTTVREILGRTEDGKKLIKQLPFGPNAITTKRGGLDPDEVAADFGYTSGEAMLRDVIPLTEMEMKRRVKDAAEDRVDEGQSRPPREKLAEDAMVAVANRKLENMILAEDVALSRELGEAPLDTRRMKSIAKAAIAETPVGSIRPAQHVREMQYQQRIALRGAQKGNAKQVQEARRRQLMQKYLFDEAMDAQQKINKILRDVARYRRGEVRKRMTLAGGGEASASSYIDQIDALLARSQLSQSAAPQGIESLGQFLKREEANGKPIRVDEDVAGRAVPWRSLDMDSFEALHDSLRNIEKLGRLELEMRLAGRKVEVAEARNTTQDGLRQNLPRRVVKVTGKDATLRKVHDRLLAFHARLRRMDNIWRVADGFKDAGALWGLWKQPADTAAGQKFAMQRGAHDKLRTIWKEYTPWALHKKMPIPGTEHALRKSEVLAIALNWGNTANRQRVLELGEAAPGVDAAHIDDILGLLTKEDWDTVQATWDLLDEYWEEIEAVETRSTGVRPRRVTRDKVKTKFGDYKGGYYPIKYDSDAAGKTMEYETNTELAGALKNMGNLSRAQTRQGHTKVRMGSGGQKLRLDLNVIPEHLNNVIHDITHRELVMGYVRLLRDAQTDGAMREHMGPATVAEIRRWVGRMAGSDRVASEIEDVIMGYLRRGSVVAKIGFKLTVILQQPFGLGNSAARVGAVRMAGAIGELLGDFATGGIGNKYKAVMLNSEFMRSRMDTFSRDAREAMEHLGKSKILRAVDAAMFGAIGKMQLAVDIPTWLAGYNKAVDENPTIEHEDAVAIADRMVRESQGSGLSTDLSAIEAADSQFKKLFTSLYSYFNVIYNLIADDLARVGLRRDTASVAKFTADFLWIVTMQATIAQLAVGRGPDDDEGWVEWALKNQLTFLTGTIPYLRDIVAGITYGRTEPAGSPIGAFARFGAQAVQGEADRPLLYSAAETVGILTHLPAGQFNAFLRGVKDYQDGKTGGIEAVVNAALPLSSVRNRDTEGRGAALAP